MVKVTEWGNGIVMFVKENLVMSIIKKIICLVAIIGSHATLNNLAMSREQALHDFWNIVVPGSKPRNLDYIHFLLANYPGLADTRLDDYYGTTLLIAMITRGEMPAWDLLRAPKTDVTLPDLKGNTPLHYLVSPLIDMIKGSGCERWIKHRVEGGSIPLALARGASPFVRNNDSESVLSTARHYCPEAYEYLANYANYAKILYNSARRGDLRGVQYALVKGNASVNMKNNDLPTRFAIPANERGNTPFHAAILAALELLPQVNRINELRNVGANKLVPASYFDKKISKLFAPIDNMLRLIKIHNPDTAIRNNNGETVGNLLSNAIYEKPQIGLRLIKILLESRKQSMEALRRAKIIG